MIGLERLDFDGEGGLLEHRSEIPEYQRRKSARHCLASMLAVATAATLSFGHLVIALDGKSLCGNLRDERDHSARPTA